MINFKHVLTKHDNNLKQQILNNNSIPKNIKLISQPKTNNESFNNLISNYQGSIHNPNLLPTQAFDFQSSTKFHNMFFEN